MGISENVIPTKVGIHNNKLDSGFRRNDEYWTLMQKRGIILLTILCLSLFAMQQWQNVRSVKSPFDQSPIFLEPLTTQEKILLGIKLPLNRLTEEELESLPHISARVAQKIVAYRLKNGPFKNVDALINVSGIGFKTVELIRPFLGTPSSTF